VFYLYKIDLNSRSLDYDLLQIVCILTVHYKLIDISIEYVIHVSFKTFLPLM